MADLLTARGWPEPDSLAIQLRDSLPEEYTVIADPALHGQPFDAVVVGPQGIFALRAKTWEGEITPARRGPWSGRAPSGQRVRYADPALEARQAVEAVRAFLRDESPRLSPSIHYLLVLVHPEARLVPSQVAEPLVVRREDLAATIVATPPPFSGALSEGGVREALAVAVRDRRLSASQRAGAPFVFRSGGLLGSGAKVWTIRAAVQHIDRHPEDALYHLHNGTLARWFSEQGAEHLAALARDVMRGRESDPQATVETFLIGTGLVRRPRLRVRPKHLYLGPVLAGDTCRARLSLSKGPGRGYLFGKVRASEPWLRVEPDTFAGRLDALVTAETEGLPISQTPWQAQILVESSASDEPVPVQVRVVAMPSPLSRYFVRPLAGALGAGAIGAGLGAALGAAGLEVPSWLAERLPAFFTPVVFWAVLVGLFWALLGIVRGLRQPQSWSVGYAVARWLLQLVAWGAFLALLAAVGYFSWTHFGPSPGEGSTLLPAGVVVLVGLALAILPATLVAIRSARRSRAAQESLPGRSRRRRLAWAAGGLLLVFVVALGAPVVGRLLQHADVGGAVDSAREWARDQWTRLETKVNEFVDRQMLRRYDRRAPAPTSTPSPTSPPTATPARVLSPGATAAKPSLAPSPTGGAGP